jgi:Cu-Zn family superoxide dismutase
MQSVAIAAVFVSVLSLVACGSEQKSASGVAAGPSGVEANAAEKAIATLAPASGSQVSGEITIVPMGDGVHLNGTVRGLPGKGDFGFHVHEKGDCSAPDASSAGGHFDPHGSPHGRAGTGPHHAGDMDNIASEAGVATVDFHLSGATLGGGSADDIVGRALIVHEKADDYTSQPSGNAGARVACGVIQLKR